MKEETSSRRGNQTIVENQEMPFDTTPSHDEDHQRTGGVVPPTPPETKTIRKDRHFTLVVEQHDEWNVGSNLKKTDKDQNQRGVMMNGHMLSLPVKVIENEERKQCRGNRKDD